METVTIPSRLRRYQDFEASLAGMDDNRKIFELESVLLNNERSSTERVFDQGNSHNETQTLQDDLSEEIETRFDLDFAYDDPAGQNQHVFNQIQVVRGLDYNKEDTKSARHGTYDRFYNSEQALQRFVEASTSFILFLRATVSTLFSKGIAK